MSPLRPTGATAGLVLAFVFDYHAPNKRAPPSPTKFRQTIAGVLRMWAPHVARVLYGLRGRPEISCAVRVGAQGEEYVEERCELGEDYWKTV